MATKETQTQYRSTCPICFKDHAVRSLAKATMVQHGYERPHGWHSNVGECRGTGAHHFGTPEGREVAADNARFVRTYAAEQRRNAETYRKTPPVSVIIDGEYIAAERRYEQVTVDKKDPRYAREIESRIRASEQQAKYADSDAATIEKAVAEWKAFEPRAVEVECGPTLHAVNAYWSKKTGREQALCGSGGMRGYVYKPTTADESKVTCRACLKAIAARAADAEISKKADALIAEMVSKYGESTTKQFSDANKKAIKEIRYDRKEIDKEIRKRATDRLER